MDKSKNTNPEENTIIIKLLDIFPSISDLKERKNDMDIIFQGLDIFYNLFELLTTKKEITLKTNNKSSIIISLIKSNNLFATSVFNIKKGIQWISFSYENKKKKDSNLAHSLIDCIKIKLNCEIQNKKINNNNIITNSKKLKNNISNQHKLNYGAVLTEDNNLKSQSFIDSNLHKFNNKLLTNKGNRKISLENSPKEKVLAKSKFTWIKNNNTRNSIKSSNNQNNIENIMNKKKNHLDNSKNNQEEKSLRRMKTKNSYSKILDDDLAIRLNKVVHKTDGNNPNLTQKRTKNNISNGNLDYSLKSNNNKNYNSGLLINNFGTSKTQKNKQMLKNKFLYNSNKKAEIKNISNDYNSKKNETEISININNNLTNSNNNSNVNISKRRNYVNRVEKSHDNIENLNAHVGTMTNRRNKDVIRDLKNNTSTNAKTPDLTRSKYNIKNNYKSSVDTDKYDKNILNEDYNKNKNSFINIFSDLDNDIEDNKYFEELSNNSIDENNNYDKLKEDFVILYNDDYVNNVQEDLLKLEIELFIEKMTGLISTYHYEINERKLQNKIIEKNLQENSEKYLHLCKLYCKLNLLKKNYKKKYLRLMKNKYNIKAINNKNFDANIKEIELFKIIFPNKNNEIIKNNNGITDKKGELKNIIKNLLSNINNKNIIKKTDLYKKWCEINKEIYIITKKKVLNKSIDVENKYRKPQARTRVIPKLQQTKFISKVNNNNNELKINSFIYNDNKSETKMIINKKGEDNYNCFTHNPSKEIYSKNSAIYSKYYSRKYAK